MNNRENLRNLIQQTELTKIELRKKIYSYLQKVYDIMVVKSMAEEILVGKLDSISDQDVIELIGILGGESQIEENKIETNVIEFTSKEIKEEKTNKVIEDSHNTLIIQLEEMKKKYEQLEKNYETAKNEKQELENVKNELINDNTDLIKRLTKLERIAESFLKYNITETKELIEVEDEEINQLYLRYKKEGATQLNKAIIFESTEEIVIPKSYYRFAKEGD